MQDGTVKTVNVTLEEMRSILEQAIPLIKDGKDSVGLSFNVDGAEADQTIVMKVSELRKLIKESELLSSEIMVPKSLEMFLDDITLKFAQKRIEPVSNRNLDICVE